MRGADANDIVRGWEQRSELLTDPARRFDLVDSIACALEAAYRAGVEAGSNTTRASIRRRLGI